MSDEQTSQKEIDKKVKFLQAQEKEDIQFILNSPQGCRFLHKLLSHCGVYTSSFDPSGSRVYYNEGQRSVGLFVISEIERAKPEAYLKILKVKMESENERGS